MLSQPQFESFRKISNTQIVYVSMYSKIKYINTILVVENNRGFGDLATAHPARGCSNQFFTITWMKDKWIWSWYSIGFYLKSVGVGGSVTLSAKSHQTMHPATERYNNLRLLIIRKIYLMIWNVFILHLLLIRCLTITENNKIDNKIMLME